MSLFYIITQIHCLIPSSEIEDNFWLLFVTEDIYFHVVNNSLYFIKLVSSIWGFFFNRIIITYLFPKRIPKYFLIYLCLFTESQRGKKKKMTYHPISDGNNLAHVYFSTGHQNTTPLFLKQTVPNHQFHFQHNSNAGLIWRHRSSEEAARRSHKAMRVHQSEGAEWSDQSFHAERENVKHEQEAPRQHDGVHQNQGMRPIECSRGIQQSDAAHLYGENRLPKTVKGAFEHAGRPIIDACDQLCQSHRVVHDQAGCRLKLHNERSPSEGENSPVWYRPEAFRVGE